MLPALDGQSTLLTTDELLDEYARSRGQSVLNFHHLREEHGLA
jgi:hypothetical protein